MTESTQPEHKEEEVPPPKTYVHYVGRWLIRPLVNTPVTPNHLTTLRLLTGIAAAVAFAMGDYFWTVGGEGCCLLFQPCWIAPTASWPG